MPISIRIGLVLLALAQACDGAPRAEKPGAPGRPGLATSPVTARGVELRVPQPGGDVVIAGEILTIGRDWSATLEGDVRVRSGGAMPFEATAARASIASGGRSAVLEGGVRASLSVGRAAGDAGAADD
ncbi:MAG: hypothetical protein M0R80_12990 [Proteobacteria bacterium]|nr:hypothetical protein [Pseudomonadota bacterium]